MTEDASEPVAVIGCAGRFPGAASVEDYWRNLLAGVVSVDELTDEDLRVAGVSAAEAADPAYVRAAPLLADADAFDAAFFGFTEREAELRDPQQRLFLEVAYSACEDAGLDPAQTRGAVGVFAGGATNRYAELNVRRNAKAVRTYGEIAIQAGNHNDYIATIVAYKLGLTGPALTVATACSTSLLAVHMACQALRAGECETALAGGVQIEMPFRGGYRWVKGGIFSRSGRCRPFDADADGTLFGNGAGAVVLKLLDDAVRDGDTVHAVIRGSAVNNDGHRKVGFTAGSVEGQDAAVYEALAVSGVDPATIGYVEGHGTGTAIGDPVEVAALTRAFRRSTARSGYCLLSSVKGNIGHLGPASGIAGLIKAVRALQDGVVPPTAGFRRPNPLIDFPATPFVVADEPRPWPLPEGPRRAGVSSFGIGGTNVHVVLEQAPAPTPVEGEPAGPVVLPLAAATATALTTLTRSMSDYVDAYPDRLPDLSSTVRHRPLGMQHRTAVVAADGDRAAQELLAAAGSLATPAQVAFVFPGQGTQYPGMAAGLHRGEPAFRTAFEECLEHFGSDLSARVRATALGDPDDPASAADLRRTELTQPALFATEWALAQLWLSWGVRPGTLLGHSIGELVAATVAGAVPLADAAVLAAERGRLVAAAPAGGMTAVPLPAAEVAGLLTGLDAWVAVVLAPDRCVVAGMPDALADAVDRLARTGVRTTALDVSHAFHTPLLGAAAEEFGRAVEKADFGPARVRRVSNRTGEWIEPGDAVGPDHWVRQLCEPVDVRRGLERLREPAGTVLIEVGPGRTLTQLARRADRDVRAVPSMPHRDDSRSAVSVLRAAAEVWCHGGEVRWRSVGGRRRTVPAPGYPFERKRYWIDPDSPADEAPVVEPAEAVPDGRPRVLRPEWRVDPAPDTARPGRAVGRVILLAAGHPVEAPLVAALDSAVDVAAIGSVTPGYGLGGQLSDRLAGSGEPLEIVSTWLLTDPPTGSDPVREAEHWLDLGFRSLLGLLQEAARVVPSRAVRVTLLTTGCVAVTGAEPVDVAKAAAPTLLRVAVREGLAADARVLDVPADLAATAPETARRIVAELGREPDPDRVVVAWRGRERWHEELVPVDADPPRRSAGGRPPVWLITGGLGALGLATAEWAGSAGPARLVLVGRTGLPPRDRWDEVRRSGSAEAAEAVETVRRLEAAGSEVLPLAADVTDRAAVDRVVATVHAAFGPVDTVVHAAGVTGGGMLAVKSPAAAEAVLRPKLLGGLNLDGALGDEPRLFVLYSSLSAVSTPYGLGDYAAANAMLDSFARRRAATRPGRTVSVGWPSWAGRGMAARARGEAAELAARRAARRGTPAEFAAEVSLSERDWVLDEHRLDGTAILPGAAYIDLLASAAWDLTGGPVELTGITFTAPLVVDGSVRLTTQLSPAGTGWTARVLREGRPGPLVTATVRPLPGDFPPHRDVAAIAALYEPADPPALNDGSGLLTVGPRWRSILDLRVGPDGAVGHLALPDEFAADVGAHRIHPALLDVATAFVLPAGGGGLPFSYRRVVVRDRVPAEVFAVVTRRGPDGRGSSERDVALVDPAGREVVSIEGFVLRSVDREMVRSAVRSGESVRTPPDPAAPAGGEPASGDLSFGDGVALLGSLLTADLGPRVVVVPAGRPVLTGRPAPTGAPPVPAARPVTAPELSADRPGPAPAPSSSMTARLTALWVEILGGSVGPDDDFFDLGGDSMTAVQLVERFQAETGIELPVSAVFDHPTVRQLADLAAAGP